MDPNIAKMIERSRARSSAKKISKPVEMAGKLSPRKIPIHVEPRSPLKPKNFDEKIACKTILKKDVEITASPSDTIKRILSRESLETSVQELLSRDSPGKTIVTKTFSSNTSSPSRTTITKTVVTETEEKYEKKETISISGNKEFLKDYESGRLKKFETGGAASAAAPETSSPTRKAYTTNASTKDGIRSTASSEILPENDNYFAARKARLANLANKFKHMEDDPLDFPNSSQDGSRSPVRSYSPTKSEDVRSRSPIKTNPSTYAGPTTPNRSLSPSKLVTNATPKPFSASPAKPAAIFSVRPHSPVKHTPSVNPAKPITRTEDSFIASLKAQGFSESESATKLVYNFEKRDRSMSPQKFKAGDGPERTVEPTFNQETRGRSMLKVGEKGSVASTRTISPSKPHPLQFVSPQVQAEAGLRSVSPNKPFVPQPQGGARLFGNVAPRSVSPSKPHPLQFVSAQVQAQSGPPVPPPKPARTYETQPSATVRASEAKSDVRCDTLVLKSVKQRKSIWESKTATPEPETVDPAMMSMSDRKALFEKNRSVPTPVARFGESVTPAMLATKSKSLSETPSEAWKRKRELSPTKLQPPAKKYSPENYVLSASKPKPVSELGSKLAARASQLETLATPSGEVARPTSPSTPHVGRKAAEIHKKLFEKPDWRGNEIARQIEETKMKDMDLLLNRYNHLKSVGEGEEKESPSQPTKPIYAQPKHANKNKASPEKYYPGVNSLKKIKVSPPKAGGLYPDIAFESDTLSSRSESAMSTDTLNSSFESIATVNSEAPSLGREIVTAARKSVAPDPNLSTIPERNDSMETDEGDELSESAVCDEIDDMLDEAMDDSVEEGSIINFSPLKPKGSTSSSGSSNVGRSESASSWEFHTPQPPTRSKVDEARFKTPLILISHDSPCDEPMSRVEGAVFHTVSFYRKQRPAAAPVKRIILNPVLEQTMVEPVESPRTTISHKIKILQEEAQSQMSVISQSSSALNLCRATKEFYGSTEQVEGERLLLVATHKRAAALSEISRLKTEGGLGAHPDEDNSVRGTVSINSISLALKKDFVKQLKSGLADEFVHYFLCLVKCAGQVIPTQMISTVDGLERDTLDFPNLMKLTDLPKNFLIQLEVYGLQTKREILDHEAKYHIKRQEKSVFSLTPKLKLSKNDARLTRPDFSSPGGPHSVRTSSFAMVGNTVITIDNLKKKDWRLESVPKVSPLEGAIRFQLNCHSESQVNYRGFLTMFEDVSGIGAWYRRWFVLEGNRLSYWKYPENQKTQDAIGSIDLGGCITESVCVAPREICSRMHTLMLESRRPGRTSDRESLVLVKQGSNTIIRHLLSADSRDERLTWCSILNQALENLRAWDPQFKDTRYRSLSSGSSEDGSSTSTEIW